MAEQEQRRNELRMEELRNEERKKEAFRNEQLRVEKFRNDQLRREEFKRSVEEGEEPLPKIQRVVVEEVQGGLSNFLVVGVHDRSLLGTSS